MFPDYVQQRLKSVYTYLGISIALTSVSAVMSFHTPIIRDFVGRQDSSATALNLISTIGSGILAHAATYQEGFGPKHILWLLHVAIMGATLSPVCILENTLFYKVIFYTMGIIVGLVTTAIIAPKDKFLMLSRPLATASDVIFCASLGRIFLPPTSTLGLFLCFLSLYGSIGLFSAYVLYDSQIIIRNAEEHSTNDEKPYDPINAALSLYTDALNIFVRIVSFVTGSECGRKPEGFDLSIKRH